MGYTEPFDIGNARGKVLFLLTSKESRVWVQASAESAGAGHVSERREHVASD